VIARLGIAAALFIALASTASANVIGTAVSGYGNTTTVGSSSSNGTINFYALLNGTGTYGVNGAGLTPDTCSIGRYSNTCTGGTLDMWLRFSPVTAGANILTLQFTDLDLFGVNDPNYFLESVNIFDALGSSLAYVTTATDPLVVAANYNQQVLQLALNVATSQYYTRLRFRTSFVGAANGSYSNTIESLLATMKAVPPVSVPEPAMLSMLGAGLLLVSFVGRRRARS
jgi:hypothetical protein